MGAAIRTLFVLIKFVLRHQEHVIPIFYSIPYFFKTIRISTAALLLLEKDGKYVLIQNHHREEYFSPIGGVHKHSNVLPQVLNDIEWSSDYTTHTPKAEDMKRDLRGVIPGRHVATFLDWFVSRKGREGDKALFRELDEELGEGKVGKTWRDRANNCNIEFVRRVIEGPRSVQGRTYHGQLRYLEIYQFDALCPNSKALQDEILERAERGENKLRIATKEEILKGRFHACNSPIAGNAKYYFSSAWHGNEPSPY